MNEGGGAACWVVEDGEMPARESRGEVKTGEREREAARLGEGVGEKERKRESRNGGQRPGKDHPEYNGARRIKRTRTEENKTEQRKEDLNNGRQS
jgi:hypothetical protein